MRAPTVGLIAALLVAGAVPAGAGAAAATKRCPDDRRARCGSVLVPLLRGAPDGGGQRLRVQFRVFPRRDRSRPGLEPLVAAEGGPGYGSIDSASLYRFMLGPLGRRHDLIVVDNRGRKRRTIPAAQPSKSANAVTWPTLRTVSSVEFGYGPVRLRLRRVRFVGDLAVSGTVEWDRRARWVRARLRLSGAHNGLVRIGWPARAPRATARLRGTLGGRAVRLRTPAP